RLRDLPAVVRFVVVTGLGGHDRLGRRGDQVFLADFRVEVEGRVAAVGVAVHGGVVKTAPGEVLGFGRVANRWREYLQAGGLRVTLHGGVEVVLKRLGRRKTVGRRAVGEPAVRSRGEI